MNVWKTWVVVSSLDCTPRAELKHRGTENQKTIKEVMDRSCEELYKRGLRYNIWWTKEENGKRKYVYWTYNMHLRGKMMKMMTLKLCNFNVLRQVKDYYFNLIKVSLKRLRAFTLNFQARNCTKISSINSPLSSRSQTPINEQWVHPFRKQIGMIRDYS